MCDVPGTCTGHDRAIEDARFLLLHAAVIPFGTDYMVTFHSREATFRGHTAAQSSPMVTFRSPGQHIFCFHCFRVFPVDHFP